MSHNTLTAMLIASGKHDDLQLTVHEAFSGVLGSVSLACWIFLLIPQLIENYRNQSAEAISLAFVIVWFLGDVANLLGAVGAGLVPTIIAIAVYFCISDGLLIGQVLYYGIRNKRREGQGLLESLKDVGVETDTGTQRHPDQPQEDRGSTDANELEREDTNPENEPLLSRKHSRQNSYSTYTIPGSADPKAVRDQLARRRSSSGSKTPAEFRAIRARRKSSSTAAASAQQEPLAKIFEEPDSERNTTSSPVAKILKNTLFIFGVVAVGSLGWLVAYKTGTWKPTPPESPDSSRQTTDSDANPAGAQFLGYLSAALYLCARLPQIWKNYREQSCEGLSLLFFILSLMGNATYGAGILAHSTEHNYVVKNVPWLLGSLGTMLEDGIVFWQFRLYANNGQDQPIVGDESAPSDATAERQVGGDNVVVGQRA
ncbi:hypothetical protein LTR70_004154 [Exophiala xenobiotica]|nr:hypothetical protein LTR70_004154 [Exophiala xenobiotica]